LAVSLAASVLVALAACDDPTSPEDLMGLYVLERTGSGPIPGAWQDLGDYSLRQVAESLFLWPGRVGEQVFVYGITSDAQPADTVEYREVWPFDYDLRGSHLRFNFRRDLADPSDRCGLRNDRFFGSSIISGDYVHPFRGRIPSP
jgi:hypothetical protein